VRASHLLDPYLKRLPIDRDSEDTRLRGCLPQASLVLASTAGTICPHMTRVNYGRHH